MSDRKDGKMFLPAPVPCKLVKSTLDRGIHQASKSLLSCHGSSEEYPAGVADRVSSVQPAVVML